MATREIWVRVVTSVKPIPVKIEECMVAADIAHKTADLEILNVALSKLSLSYSDDVTTCIPFEEEVGNLSKDISADRPLILHINSKCV